MSKSEDTFKNLGPQIIMYAPHAKALGLEFVGVENGEVTARAPYRDDLVGDPDTGVIAGGVVTVLLDQVCGMAVLAALEAYTSTATLDLRIDYMRPAQPGKAVMAVAKCYKLTRSVAFVRATAYDDDIDDPVAAAQAAFMLDSNNGRKAGANLRRRKPA